MEHFVITIEDNEKSVKAAQRCIDSAAKFGMEVKMWPAVTPAKNDIDRLMAGRKINDKPFFNSMYSREDNARAAFLSHHSLWTYAAETKQEITIFEHDAVVVDPIPNMVYAGLISLGHPSYGNFRRPTMLGTNQLTSKPYLPGAHAYRIKPKAAMLLIQEARLEARPTDMFINVKRFPFVEEYYPWPVQCKDSFTTIQKTYGCIMKHGYNDDYVIEEV